MIIKTHSSSLQYVSYYTSVDGSAPPATITNDHNYLLSRHELRQRDVIMKHSYHWCWLINLWCRRCACWFCLR